MELIPVLKFGTVSLSALLIFAAHWFPWPMVFGRRLKRLEAYAAGTLAIFVPATLAVFAGLDDLDAIDTLTLFWLALSGAGGATLAAWGIDSAVSSYHAMKDRIDRAELSSRYTDPTE